MSVKLELWEILVPYKMGRKNVQLPYHKEWDEKVIAITGGLTIYKTTKGIWTSPTTNKTHKEAMIPVRIACSKEQFEQIIDITITHYKQEAVFGYKVSDEVLIRYAGEQNG